MASLPLAGQSVQPLLRQLACSVPVLPLEVELSLEMQVLMVGKMPDLQNSLSSAAHGLRKQSREGAVCSSHGLTYGTGQGGTGWVLTCSTRAGAATFLSPSLFLRVISTTASCCCSGKEGSGMAARHGWLPGGLSTVSQPAMPVHRASRLSLHPCEPGGVAGTGSETLALLLHISVCCTYQILCRHVSLGRAGPSQHLSRSWMPME